MAPSAFRKHTKQLQQTEHAKTYYIDGYKTKWEQNKTKDIVESSGKIKIRDNTRSKTDMDSMATEQTP
jgi:hypothetical protein